MPSSKRSTLKRVPPARRDELDDHAHGDAQAADAGPPAHDPWIGGEAPEVEPAHAGEGGVGGRRPANRRPGSGRPARWQDRTACRESASGAEESRNIN